VYGGKPEWAQGKVVFDASDRTYDHTQKFTVQMRKPPPLLMFDASDHAQKFTVRMWKPPLLSCTKVYVNSWVYRRGILSNTQGETFSIDG